MASSSVLALLLICITVSLAKETLPEDDDPVISVADNGVEEFSVDPEKLEYAKGSVCGYCEHCKFCDLCDKDCPCETSKSKPNCKMCKYCKYCPLCSGVCDTVCTPGGVLDRMTGAIFNSLPTTVNHDEVNEDIESVRHFINQKRDEL